MTRRISRRKFFKELTIAGIVAGVSALGIGEYLSKPTTTTLNTSSVTTTGSTTVSSTTSISPPTSVASILAYHGLKNRTVVAYGAPFEGNLGTFQSLQAEIAYYLSQNIKAYPWQDGSNGYTSDLATIVSAYLAANGIILGPAYGWGYAVQFFDPRTGNTNTVTLWPNEQEWYLKIGVNLSVAANSGATVITCGDIQGFPGFSQGQTITLSPGTTSQESDQIVSASLSNGIWTINLSNALINNHTRNDIVSNGQNFLTPATSYGYPGVVIDAPELVGAWQGLYSVLDQKVGLQNLTGIAGWVNSDHPVNYGGAQGQSGGHNMNTYVRYVNNLPGFSTNYYLQDVNSSGKHNSDGTTCLLWTLKGLTANFTQAQPTVQMAFDIQTYHHGGFSSGKVNITQTSSFSLYMADANSNLEYSGCLQPVLLKNNGYAFARTSMPLNIINATSYAGAMLETTSASIYNLINSTPTLLTIPYFNFANPGDNGSNPGRTGIYEVATPATVQDFWSRIVPQINTPIVEADTDPRYIVAQVGATNWTQYANAYGQLTLTGYFLHGKNNIPSLFYIDDSIMLPAIKTKLNSSRMVIASVLGEYGSKKQVWLSNPGEDTRFVQLHLSSKLFDIKNPGRCTDICSNRNVSTGDNEDMEIGLDVPAKSWVILNTG